MAKVVKKDFPLLIYQALVKQWLWPAVGIIFAGGALWGALRQSSTILHINPAFAPAGLLISGVGGLILGYVLLARRARITCYPNRFVLHTPFYPIAFSYKRMELVRPMEFSNLYPPQAENQTRWQLYQNIWGRTAIVVNLKSYPMPLWWLKLWLHPYLFHPKEIALVFLVENWMGLSQTLDGMRVSWREAKKSTRRE